MRLGNLFLIALCSLLVFSSCSKMIFSESMFKALDASSVPKVQYYVSRQIVLRRELNKGEAAVANGKIKFRGGKYYEFITIPRGAQGTSFSSYTPGGSVFMDLSFYRTGTDRTLRFDNSNCKFPEKAPDGSKPFGVFWTADSSIGRPVRRVKFGDKDYELRKGSFVSHLLVKKKFYGFFE